MSPLLGRDRKGSFTVAKLNGAALAVALISLGLQFGAPAAMADSPAPPIAETQAKIKRLGFGISLITLPAKAASRLDITTAEIREDQSGRKITPFSSIIYDLDGDAWVYTVPEPLSFVRESVVVALVKGNDVYLEEGPPAGTKVVTVGVPELYGTEVGVNGE
jgi:hypothetical protein